MIQWNLSLFQGREFALGFLWGTIFVFLSLIGLVRWIFLDVTMKSSQDLKERKKKFSISTIGSAGTELPIKKSSDWLIHVLRFAIRAVANKFAGKVDLQEQVAKLPPFVSQLEVKDVRLNHSTLSVHSIYSSARGSDSLHLEAVVEWIDAAEACIDLRLEVGIQEVGIALPCSLKVAIERLVACVELEASSDGRIELHVLERDLVCDLKLSSAIGYKYALCDVPQVHEFIKQKVLETLSGFKYCLVE